MVGVLPLLDTVDVFSVVGVVGMVILVGKGVALAPSE
jgi:hypothetical protein